VRSQHKFTTTCFLSFRSSKAEFAGGTATETNKSRHFFGADGDQCAPAASSHARLLLGLTWRVNSIYAVDPYAFWY